ncbi:MAG TPA: flagellar hook-basal body complex protein FliE [Burkholderiaceae bacterium]|nr:flagellar hook-basal body complex protein FliE [Burkholderiaceae bacterium]
MDVKLKPFDFASAVARAGLRPDGTPLAGGTSPSTAIGSIGSTSKADFGSAMTLALKSVSDSQNQATTMQNELQMDNPTVSLEQTMVQMQKAQIGFQAVLSVRNRLVQSYTDVMNMQV